MHHGKRLQSGARLIGPVGVLRRKRRGDAGAQASTTPALLAQYGVHKSWSAQLHHDNLAALAQTRPELRPVPSYTTVRRFLVASGLTRRRAARTRQTEGALAAAARLEVREVPHPGTHQLAQPAALTATTWVPGWPDSAVLYCASRPDWPTRSSSANPVCGMCSRAISAWVIGCR